MKLMQKGFSVILVLISVLVLVGIVGGAYFLLPKTQTKTTQQIVPPITPQPTPTPNQTANWKTYTNTKYGYSIKYPNTWYVIFPGNDGAESINLKSFQESAISQQEQHSLSLGKDKIMITLGFYGQINNSQPLLEWLKSNGKYVSNMTGVPQSVENSIIANKPVLKMNYQTGPFYVFSNGKNVFYVYFTPENSNLTSIFDQILSTFKFN